LFKYLTIDYNQYYIDKLLEGNTKTTKNIFLVDKNKLLLYLIYSSLNFKFWIDKSIYWSDENHSGATRLFKILDAMVEKENNYLDFFDKLTYDDFSKYISSENSSKLSYLEIRYNYIKEIVKLIKNNFNSDIEFFISSQDYDALKIVHYLSNNTIAFSDSVEFNGEKLYLVKKATFFIKLLLQTKNYNRCLKNIDKLQVLSDYRIPQLLRYFRILKYSKKLAKKVDNQEILTERYEKEIRVATVMFSNSLINNNKVNLTILELDEYLWRKAKELEKENPRDLKPFHLAETTKY